MIRTVWSWIVIVGATIALGSAAIVACLLRPGSDAVFLLTKVWSRAILRAGNVRIVVEDENFPPRPSPAVYVCNHRSNLDVWAVSQALPDSTRFVAKRSLFRVPFLGWAMSAGGFVPVDRGRREKAIASLNQAGSVSPPGRRSSCSRKAPAAAMDAWPRSRRVHFTWHSRRAARSSPSPSWAPTSCSRRPRCA